MSRESLWRRASWTAGTLIGLSVRNTTAAFYQNCRDPALVRLLQLGGVLSADRARSAVLPGERLPVVALERPGELATNDEADEHGFILVGLRLRQEGHQFADGLKAGGGVVEAEHRKAAPAGRLHCGIGIQRERFFELPPVLRLLPRVLANVESRDRGIAGIEAVIRQFREQLALEYDGGPAIRSKGRRHRWRLHVQQRS